MPGIYLGLSYCPEVLGGRVYLNVVKEIVCFPVMFQGHGKRVVFHWHGDTFSIPEGATHFAQSEGCLNQGFSYNDGQVLALQFHLEMNDDAIESMLYNGAHELVVGPYIMGAEMIRSEASYHLETTKTLLFDILDEKLRF